MTTSATRASLAVVLASLMTVLAGPARAATTVVEVGADGQNVFAPASVTITAGDTVEWRNIQGYHNVAASDGSFGNGVDNSAWVYRHTFNSPGTFAYTCQAHRGMDGTVTVQAASSPPATAAPSPAPSPAATTPATPAPTATASTSPAPATTPTTSQQPETDVGTGDPPQTQIPEPSPTVSVIASPTDDLSDLDQAGAPEPAGSPLPSPVPVVAAADPEQASTGDITLFVGIVLVLLLAGAGAMLWARRRAGT